MTQLQPAPQDPSFPPVDGYSPEGGQGPVKYSSAAIAAFVLSILGCLGITGLVGLVLAFIGIAKTRGGRMRGRGFAIAAIPISLVTLAVFAFSIVTMFYAAGAMKDVMARLPEVLGSDVPGRTAAAIVLGELATDEFNEEVSTEAVEAWIERVQAKHGKLVEVAFSPVQSNTGQDGGRALNFEGKFVNGSANITIVVKSYDLKIDDIEVDGDSPRGGGD